MKTNFFLLLSIYYVQSVFTQISLPTLPNLSQIVAREVTGSPFNHTYNVNDARLFTRLGAGLSSTNDFGGVPGAENYDIYYSDASGNLDVAGAYITIECRYLGTSGGGGCNIAHLELVFSNGFKISSNILANFYGTGSNYIAGSELNAVDCNPNTFTTMGNNSATPNTMFLSLTFDFSTLINEVNITACQGDGTQYVSGGTTFNEQNPSGNGYINNGNCYNSIEIEDITFEPLNFANFTYTGCQGDNFSITLGGITFDEQNPSGQAIVPSTIGCDTLYTVNLNFGPLINENFNYTGCHGDNFSITLGGITFDEQNPSGQALVPSTIGCDTLYTVNLNFGPLINENFNYTGCQGDNFSITLGGIIFDEQNPFGQALVQGVTGCDTLYTVNLNFVPQISESYTYNGCQGDNFSIMLGGIIFDEQNPSGQALVPSTIGCDTLYTVNLNFGPLINENFNYTGCQGDNFTITFGGTTFNEQNPSGQALVPGIIGCDTLYDVNLIFDKCVDCTILTPNIISLSSPLNSEFSVTYNDECMFNDFTLSIFDRWGNLVKSGDDNRWNGKFNEIPCALGVYVFVILFTIDVVNFIKSGDITLIK